MPSLFHFSVIKLVLTLFARSAKGHLSSLSGCLVKNLFIFFLPV